jgi:hypothetical protein
MKTILIIIMMVVGLMATPATDFVYERNQFYKGQLFFYLEHGNFLRVIVNTEYEDDLDMDALAISVLTELHNTGVNFKGMNIDYFMLSSLRRSSSFIKISALFGRI